MHVIKVKNVREALPEVLGYLLLQGRKEASRNGEVRAAAEPVCIHYTKPKQHVLLSPVRDANPFFHLMESMWMLGGRHDAKFLDRYVSNFGQLYSTDGIVMDAYGYRWRYGLHGDQLREIISMLRADATTRHCVLQMWGAGREDLWAGTQLPCNLVATFRIRNYHLDMTVFNRSNDLIFGACGANAVHFAILQEYIAEMVGVPMGQYWQISTNMHLYMDHIENMLQKRLKDYEDLVPTLSNGNDKPYGETKDLITIPKLFDEELIDVLNLIDNLYKEDDNQITWPQYQNNFLSTVVWPMACAHWHYKKAHDFESALAFMEKVAADDWRQAGTEWLQRRVK